MIKVRSKRFDAIVTGHAVCAEGQEVFSGEHLVNLQVTISAGILIERRGVTIYMAVLAGECRTIRLLLVRSQFE